ncbi:DUF6942 family protein [Shewanella aestuarii]|uniref:Uncharacterized protein n=1 Tax=Shewanella aestuarii TaxID=1028752 RepID=A0A6G9QJY4_9GAMM|nr:hypothetical protein [Shewanella aestuarii]QIR14870.1 hypothetical protein HBH39_10570 [Shewanella aestuarii]
MPSLPIINLTSVQFIGHQSPEVIFYLPNAPILTHDWQADDLGSVDKLIADNGNHWRKIIVIASKLVAINLSNWREIKPNLLSSSIRNTSGHLKCALAIVPSPSDNHPLSTNLNSYHNDKNNPQVWHIICGLETLKRLGLQSQQFDNKVSLNQQQSLYYQEKLMFTPYLDYRQFPNNLIELARDIIHATQCQKG